MAHSRTTPVYPIGVVKKLTGLTERQIRYYDKMGVVPAERTKGNKRLYSPEDIETLKEVKVLLARGLKLEEVKAELRRREGISLPRLREMPDSSDAAARFARPPITPQEGYREVAPQGGYRGELGTGYGYIEAGVETGEASLKGPPEEEESGEAGEPRLALKSLYPVIDERELVKAVEEARREGKSKEAVKLEEGRGEIGKSPE